MLRSSRKLVAVVAALSAVAVSLALVAIGQAGSTGGTMQLFEMPVNLTTGQQGLAWAKFKPVVDPTSGSNGTGSATHVVMTITVPDAATGTNSAGGSLSVTLCQGGTVAYPTATSATCSIPSVANGVQVAMFVTFIAGTFSSYPHPATVTGVTTWDAGGGSAGKSQSTDTLVQNYTIYAPTGTNIFAGRCSNTMIDSTNPLFADDTSKTGKTGTLTTPTTVGNPDFPCTPAYVGVDESAVNPAGFTPGRWNVQLLPLSGNQLASVTLTSTTVRSGFNAKNMPLFEIRDSGLHQVLNCNGTQLPAPTNPSDPPEDSCIVSQGKFGSKGVQFLMLIAGTPTDPGYAG